MREPQTPVLLTQRKSPAAQARRAGANEPGVDLFVVERGAHLSTRAVATSRSSESIDDTLVVAQGTRESDTAFLARVCDRIFHQLSSGITPRSAHYFLPILAQDDDLAQRVAISGALIRAVTNPDRSSLTLVGEASTPLHAQVEFWQLVERVTPLASAANVELHALPHGYEEAQHDVA